jgi:FKBP-type peptidyl-prolyl cis-trans isomerase SlyD
MKISKNSVVTLDYSVADVDGNIVDEGVRPVVYLHGGYDGVFPKIEQTLDGKNVGDSFDIKMVPEDAFGEYEEDFVEIEERSQFPDDLQVGMQFQQGDGNDNDSMFYTVTNISDEEVVLDANHPLAGMELIFSCTVTAVREATADEIAARQAVQPEA